MIARVLKKNLLLKIHRRSGAQESRNNFRLLFSSSSHVIFLSSEFLRSTIVIDDAALFGSHESESDRRRNSSSWDCGEGMFVFDDGGEQADAGDSERGVSRLFNDAAAADEDVKLFICGGNKCDANAKPGKPAK